MKKRYGRAKMLGIMLGLALAVLAGCGILPDPPLREEAGCKAARLEISLNAAIPEEVAIAWDPASVTVDKAEVRMSDSGADSNCTVIVTVQLRPGA